jgi:hypothetical protein
MAQGYIALAEAERQSKVAGGVSDLGSSREP